MVFHHVDSSEDSETLDIFSLDLLFSRDFTSELNTLHTGHSHPVPLYHNWGRSHISQSTFFLYSFFC